MNIRNKFLMYSTVVPYTVALLGGACAPKSITPATPTLTERIQETRTSSNVYQELTDLFREISKNIGHGYFEFENKIFYLDSRVGEGREDYHVRIIEPLYNQQSVTDILIKKSKDGSSESVDFYYPSSRTKDMYFRDSEENGQFTSYTHIPVAIYDGDVIMLSGGKIKKRTEMANDEIRNHQEKIEDGLRNGIEAIRLYIRLKPELISPFKFFQQDR